MAKETYEAAHKAWQETRVKVSRLQGEYQKCLNEKNTMKESVDTRRRYLQAEHRRTMEQFDADTKEDRNTGAGSSPSGSSRSMSSAASPALRRRFSATAATSTWSSGIRSSAAIARA